MPVEYQSPLIRFLQRKVDYHHQEKINAEKLTGNAEPESSPFTIFSVKKGDVGRIFSKNRQKEESISQNESGTQYKIELANAKRFSEKHGFPMKALSDPENSINAVRNLIEGLKQDLDFDNPKSELNKFLNEQAELAGITDPDEKAKEIAKMKNIILDAYCFHLFNDSKTSYDTNPNKQLIYNEYFKAIKNTFFNEALKTDNERVANLENLWINGGEKGKDKTLGFREVLTELEKAIDFKLSGDGPTGIAKELDEIQNPNFGKSKTYQYLGEKARPIFAESLANIGVKLVEHQRFDDFWAMSNAIQEPKVKQEFFKNFLNKLEQSPENNKKFIEHIINGNKLDDLIEQIKTMPDRKSQQFIVFKLEQGIRSRLDETSKGFGAIKNLTLNKKLNLALKRLESERDILRNKPEAHTPSISTQPWVKPHTPSSVLKHEEQNTHNFLSKHRATPQETDSYHKAQTKVRFATHRNKKTKETDVPVVETTTPNKKM